MFDKVFAYCITAKGALALRLNWMMNFGELSLYGGCFSEDIPIGCVSLSMTLGWSLFHWLWFGLAIWLSPHLLLECLSFTSFLSYHLSLSLSFLNHSSL